MLKWSNGLVRWVLVERLLLAKSGGIECGWREVCGWFGERVDCQGKFRPTFFTTLQHHNHYA